MDNFTHIAFSDFWDNLSEEDKDTFIKKTSDLHLKKGDFVRSEREKCQGLIFIKSGALRTYLLSEDGREVTLYRLHEGDVCILSASCILDTISFDVFIDAEEDTVVQLTDMSFYGELTENNIYVRCFGYRIATERFSDVMWAMQQMLFMRIDQRLAIYLWDESVRTGSLQIKATQEEVAIAIGSAREVVSRMLKMFSDEGIVRVFRGGIEIKDRAKLHSLTL
ncbi:MAG TPA: Crp/Fnr family transcriptional regulator [Mogibacterium sp.]|nr:Crp/Fnr family transcriptional regulator [Mogibacterium sp.]